MAKKNKQLDMFAITNDIQTSSIEGRSVYSGNVINFGLDNLYPNKVFEITQNSPTASGCISRKADFVFGKGVDSEIIVNRHEQTINDVLNISVNDFCKYNGYALHFNYNLFGQIVEIQPVDLRYIRKLRGLQAVVVGKINRDSRVIYLGDNKKIKLPLYKKNGIRQYIKEVKGFKKFQGAIYYFNNNSGIYPVCHYEASLTSAQFEHEAQVYSYMAVQNGFSSSGLLKLPSVSDDPEKKKEQEKEIGRVVGSRNAGSVLVVEMPLNIEGAMDKSKLFEPFQTQDVDKLHEVQSERARKYILEDFTMPETLLGAPSQGMFNQASYADAFDYMNGDTEKDRIKIERSFNKFWPETSFSSELSEIEIIPLEMKNDQETQKESENVSTDNTE